MLVLAMVCASRKSHDGLTELWLDPVKFRLISLEAAMTILKLSTAIYPPGVWANISLEYDEGSPDSLEEAWTLRSGLSNWAWRTISELKDVKDESENSVSLHTVNIPKPF